MKKAIKVIMAAAVFMVAGVAAAQTRDDRTDDAPQARISGLKDASNDTGKNPDISRNQGSPLHYPDRTSRTSNAPNEDSDYSGGRRKDPYLFNHY